METHNDLPCWKNFGKSGYIWIIVAPIMVALVVNLLFLVNIMRILLTKIQLATVSSDSTQLRRAAKATIVLFPLLGVNNLLFLFNPGGDYEAAYYITNAVLQSSQGVIVSILYCFMSKEVRAAIRREYRKATVTRTATMRRSTVRGRRRSSGCANQNSVYWDNPTSVTFQNSFHRRASILISKIKTPTSLLIPRGTNGMVGSGVTVARSAEGTSANGHRATWTTNTAIVATTQSPETVGLLPTSMTVTFSCHAKNSNSNSTEGKSKSDCENNEIVIEDGQASHCCLDCEGSRNETHKESFERNSFPPRVL